MKNIWKAFNTFEESIMVIGMAIMVTLNFVNVVCRYLFPQTPFSYTEELVVILFIWVNMFGISYGYRKSSHTVLTLVSDLVPNKFQPILIVIASLASAFLMLLLAYTGYGMVMNQIKYGQILPGMRVPMAIVGWAIPVGAVVSFISIIKAALIEIQEVKKIEQNKEEVSA